MNERKPTKEELDKVNGILKHEVQAAFLLNTPEPSSLAKDISDHYQIETEERMQLLAREQAARAEAEAQKNRTQNILESIADAFFTLDQQWKFTYLNSRAEQVLFRSKKQLLGINIWEEFPDFISTTFELEFKRSVVKKTTAHFEAFYSVLGIWFEVRAYPYEEGLSVYFRDVTERKQTEVLVLERSRLSALEAEVGLALVKGGTLRESLKHCTQAIVQHTDATYAGIWTFNQETNFLELQALISNSDAQLHIEDISHTYRLSLDGSLLGFVAQSRQPYLTQDSSQRGILGFEMRLYQGRVAESCSLIPNSYFAGYPLIVEERLVGVMAIGRNQFLSETVHSALCILTNTVAVGIDRYWAREALLSRREALLFRLANQVRNSLDLDTILGTAVNEILSVLKVDRCHFVWCWPHPTNPSLSVTHEAIEDPNLPSLINEFSSPQLVHLALEICNLQTLRIDNTDASIAIAIGEPMAAALYKDLANFGISSLLLVPLKTRAGQLGAIICSQCNEQRHWTNNEVELLLAVVDQLAIAIDQAELFAQTRAAAFAAQTQAKQLQLAIQDLKQAESKLIQTEKMSSLGQMVAGIAHEINNPVNFINGNLGHTSNYIQSLLKLIDLYAQCYPNPDHKIQSYTEEIDLDYLIEDLPKMLSSMQVGADRIRQIVLSLRNFSRLDEADKKAVDIHEGIDSTLLLLQHRLKACGDNAEIQIIKEYETLPKVECYPSQLNQVFMNILSNAIDAIENLTAPKITIKTTQSTDSVIINISDNGPGIPESVIKRVFDPFFTTKPVGKGTGLGLSISYQIVEKHRGILKCVSAPERGAEFEIEIPIQQ